MLAEAEQLSERDFRRLSDAVYAHCGINLHDGKQDLVKARIAKRLRETGHRTPGAYLDAVLADPANPEFTKLIDALSTNLTSFFRENQHFQFLAREHLPKVVAEKQKVGDRRLRAWSAGCSTGEEPYTIAITLLESLPTARQWDIKLLATDISTNVLRHAMAGVYPADRLASVPAALRDRYFEKSQLDGRPAYACGDVLRNLIRFNYLNLMERWPFRGPFDFIFCRNVMIYFDKPTQAKLVNRYYDCLAPGGVLFTGHSESLAGIEHRFDFVEPTIYRKD